MPEPTALSCAAAVPIFRGLPPEGLQRLGEAMQHRAFCRGETVLMHDTPLEFLVIVAVGELRLARTTAGGREQVIRVLGPGDFLGEMALFTRVSLEGDLVATQDTNVCLVSRSAVQGLLRDHNELAVDLVEALAQRLFEAEELVTELGLRDVSQRLAAALLRYGEEIVRQAEGEEAELVSGVQVRLPMSWAELALRLSTTPETLSRRLKALVAQGLIRQKSQRVLIIKDPEGLRDLAET